MIQFDQYFWDGLKTPTRNTTFLILQDSPTKKLHVARAVRVHTKKMEALFEAADENGNGRLDQVR